MLSVSLLSTSLMRGCSYLKGRDYDTILFDTAPTGHTLRLLEMPDTLNNAINKALELNDRMGGMLSQAGIMLLTCEWFLGNNVIGVYSFQV